jgi:hypothetical protein
MSDLQQDLMHLRDEAVLGGVQVMPERVVFEGKESDEQVLLVLRPHPMANLKWVSIAVLGGLIPVTIINLPVVLDEIPQVYVLVISIVWVLLVFGYALEQFLGWFFNIFIVTNERVVDIDFHNLLYREISDADLDKIQDLTIRGAGMMSAFFHFGDIVIQTAGNLPVLEFHSVENPERVAKVIRLLGELREQYKQVNYG